MIADAAPAQIRSIESLIFFFDFNCFLYRFQWNRIFLTVIHNQQSINNSQC